MTVGEYNELEILRFTAPGAYLGDNEGNEVLLPGKYIVDSWGVGDNIRVFIYKDSEDRIVATTEHPYITLGEFACLKVKEVNSFGAFLDWGLEKDLMVPFKEQNLKMEEGKYYVVTLLYDYATERLYASSKINRYLIPCTDNTLINQKVSVLITETTDLGVKVIVDDKYQGLIFRNDIDRPIRRGEKKEAFIYAIREDGKVDVRFQKEGFEKFDEAAEKILSRLKEAKTIYLSDKSSPEEIREELEMSKKIFKQAIGKLYKARKISIEDQSISLLEE